MAAPTPPQGLLDALNAALAAKATADASAAASAADAAAVTAAQAKAAASVTQAKADADALDTVRRQLDSVVDAYLVPGAPAPAPVILPAPPPAA